MKLGLVLIGALVWFVLGGIVSAQEEQRTEISVSPAIIEVIAEPGSEQVKSITIRNGGDSSLPVSLEMQSLVNYDGFLDFDTTLSDASKWVEPADSAIVLAPNESRKVQLNFDVPDNATSGGHYAQLDIRALILKTDQENQNSIVIPEIAVTMLVIVPGDLVESYRIESDNFFPLFNVTGNSQSLNFSVKNTGNTHGIITPILVLSEKGEEISRKQLRSKLILPSTSKEYNENWIVPDAHGKYTSHLEFNVAGSEEIVSSEQETMFVTYSFFKLGLFAILTVTIIHLIKNWKNVKKAYLVLRYGKKH